MRLGMSSFPTRLKPSQVQALRWMVRRGDGAMPIVEDRAYRAWLDASEEHRRAAAQVDHYWHMLGALSNDPEILAMMSRPQPRPKPVKRGATAAVACMLMACVVGIGWMIADHLQVHRLISLAPMGPQATVQSSVVTSTSGHITQTVRTAVGQRSTQRLPDGSMVTLDSGSTMLAHFDGKRRSIELLRGRAYFQVAQESRRPFRVTAAGKTVVATGTAFAVDVEREGMVVTLVEGSVRVEAPRQMLRPPQVIELQPGDQLVASTGLRRDIRTEVIDVERAVSWTSGRLHFRNEPMAAAVAEVNRYSKRKIVIRDSSIADLPIVGTFPTGDVDAFVRAIRLHGLASVRRDTDGRIELVAAHQGP